LLAFAGKVGVNPDQRMQADAQHLTELSAELSIGLLRALLLLVGFAGVLWLPSDQVLITVHDQSFTVPGYLLWCALAYAASGSWLTWRVGRPLVAINAERYACEQRRGRRSSCLGEVRDLPEGAISPRAVRIPVANTSARPSPATTVVLARGHLHLPPSLPLRLALRP
jgi:hypothetical protein